MSLAVLYSRARDGICAPLVSIEVHISNGLPALSIVGLPEMAVRESKDRVRGAILNSQFEFPTRRITINMAPADLPKEGGRFDLPIALGILAASGQIPQQECSRYEFAGELALSGQLRPIKGVLPIALAAKAAGRSLMVPEENGAEASLADGITAYTANHLLQVCEHLIQGNRLTPATFSMPPAVDRAKHDLADIRGQAHAKRALEVAAAGGHSMLMIGPPGSGKSMLASRLPGILPPMTEDEALESAAVLSISDRGFNFHEWKRRPFRSPHHTASAVALVGGGSNPRPGEISLAHQGVMFLDELPEFDRRVLEVLREPIESGSITISRAAHQAEFPARFQLVTAMNPCPCGHLGDNAGHSCSCTSEQVNRYRQRISGPLLDRIDIHIEVPRVPPKLLQQRTANPSEKSQQVRARVEQARTIQLARGGVPNSALTSIEVEQFCRLNPEATQLLHRAMEQLGLSARAYHRILKLARTIADLDNQKDINTAHLGEAIGYRRLDRRR
jgi:magnesium chelatase family protein